MKRSFDERVENIERQIDALSSRIASTNNPIEKIRLFDERDELRVQLRIMERSERQRLIEIPVFDLGTSPKKIVFANNDFQIL
jgi:hypothetical protein